MMNNGTDNNQPDSTQVIAAIDKATFEITGAIAELRKDLGNHFAELQNTLRAIEGNTHKDTGQGIRPPETPL